MRNSRKLFSCSVFFSQELFLSLGIYELQDSRGRRRLIVTPFYHFHVIREHLGIKQVIIAESSSLDVASDQTQTGSLWFSLLA